MQIDDIISEEIEKLTIKEQKLLILLLDLTELLNVDQKTLSKIFHILHLSFTYNLIQQIKQDLKL